MRRFRHLYMRTALVKIILLSITHNAKFYSVAAVSGKTHTMMHLVIKYNIYYSTLCRDKTFIDFLSHF